MELEDSILCISFFDQKIGPTQFYCNSNLNDKKDAPNLNKILEFNDEEGSFIFAFRDYQTVNHIFFIDSKYARGGEELFMISYILNSAYFRSDIIDIFNHLENSKEILEKFAFDLKGLKEIALIIHENLGKSMRYSLLDLVSEEFKNTFLKLFNTYSRELRISFDKNELKYSKMKGKKIFIFGDRSVGKTTLLENIKAIQFNNQNNNDLPSMIYEFVIDNIKILAYDCVERDFNCDYCKNYRDCLKNSQAYIFILDISTKNSLKQAKVEFQKLINQCEKIDNKKTPIIIIGNKIHDKEEITQKELYDAFDFEELKHCGIKIKYFAINLLKENDKIIDSLRWLIINMI